MVKKTGLGKGLSSLISESAIEAHVDEQPAQQLRADANIPLDKIHPNIHQPRTVFDEAELNELADSIKAVGVLQPILVRHDGNGYEIIAGERRYQAAMRAQLTEIPAIIRDIDDNETLEIALIENIQRCDLNAIEEARAYHELIQRTGITQTELAKRLSKSRSAVANTMRLLDLPGEVQDLLFDGKITAGHARALLALEDGEAQIELANRIVEQELSVRDVEQIVAKATNESKEKPSKVRATLPTAFKRISDDLSSLLNTGVKIKKDKESFKIEIKFTDENDLNRILSSLIR